jgi:hypothetical protein
VALFTKTLKSGSPVAVVDWQKKQGNKLRDKKNFVRMTTTENKKKFAVMIVEDKKENWRRKKRLEHCCR